MTNMVSKFDLEPNVAAERAGQMQQASEAAKQIGARTQEFIQAKRRENTSRQIRQDVGHMKKALQTQRTNFSEALKLENKLRKIDNAATDKLLTAEKKFKRDEFGRKLLSERQLMDWMNSKARSEEEWKDYATRTEDLHKKRVILLEASYRKLEQAEKQLYQKFGQELDQATKEELMWKKQDLAKEIAAQKRKARNRGSLITGLFTVGGAAAGTYFGGPKGAMAGASAGAAVGGQASQALEGQ